MCQAPLREDESYSLGSYFRQLQEISDSVTEVEWEGDILAAIETCKAQQADMDTMINTARARMRYLEHLVTDKSTIMDEDENSCVLCKCDFKRGYMTQW
jgi:E3 ubiquitin-protein ligase SHPRH